MDDNAELSALLSRLRAGDESAAKRLYERYGPFIRTTVRRRLHHSLRSRFDSLDFVHDVWASFLAIPAEQYDFATAEELLGFLNRVAYNKVVEVFRHRIWSQKAKVNREVTIDPMAEDDYRTLPSPMPTPSQWLIADEELDQMLNRLPLGHRAVVLRLREGYSIDDIARLTNLSRRTVDRIVRRLKEITGD